ncbi:DNA-binding transcriptional response regulator [Bacillus solitudinis]|uniref:response regulator n=1 Tax=Bacillus solitudinis TaxID=2014074 RepID=UPI000C23EC1F|nr:response regulator [Bacillus solitudinis]
MSLHITIVEDEPSHVILMEYHLRKMGIEAHLFQTGQAFIEQIHTIDTDLIILSDELQDVSASRLVNEVELMYRVEKPTLMIMSTGRHPSLHSNTLKIIYCSKPFAIQDFREKVYSYFYGALSTSN